MRARWETELEEENALQRQKAMERQLKEEGFWKSDTVKNDNGQSSKWSINNLDKIDLKFPKGTKNLIRARLRRIKQNYGGSANAFMVKAIMEAVEIYDPIPEIKKPD